MGTTATTLFDQVDEDNSGTGGANKYYHRCDSGCTAHGANLQSCNAPAGAANAAAWGANGDTGSATRIAQDDGLFQEKCALMALCDPLDNGCGGTCGMPDCSQAIGRVVGVEFDTWNNLNLHDPKQ